MTSCRPEDKTGVYLFHLPEIYQCPLIYSLKLRVCDDIKIAERIFENSYLPVRTECQEEARYYFYLQPEPATGAEKTIKFFDDRGGGGCTKKLIYWQPANPLPVRQQPMLRVGCTQ